MGWWWACANTGAFAPLRALSARPCGIRSAGCVTDRAHVHFLDVIAAPAGHGHCPGRLTWTSPSPVDALRCGASRFVGNGSALAPRIPWVDEAWGTGSCVAVGAVKREARPAPRGRDIEGGGATKWGNPAGVPRRQPPGFCVKDLKELKNARVLRLWITVFFPLKSKSYF